MANSTVVTKNTGDQLAAAEVNNIVASINSKQDALTFTPESQANKGQPNGYAGLDNNGLLLASQYPAGIDKIEEFANMAAFPQSGSVNIIYLALDTLMQYRWSGTVYSPIVAAAGTTDAVPEGNNNKYFTAARVIATILTGIGFGSATAVTAADNILQAIGKLQAQITALFKIPAGGTAGQVLSKVDGTDGNTAWVTPSNGGAPYTLPVATAAVLGGVKQGAGVSIAGDGTVSVTGAVSNNVLALSGAATPVTWDFSTGNMAKLTLSQDTRLIINNLAEGDCGLIRIQQDSTGGHALTLPVGSAIPAGFTPTTTANGVDILGFVYINGELMWTADLNFGAPTSATPAGIWENLIGLAYNAGTNLLTYLSGGAWTNGATWSQKITLNGTGEQGRVTFNPLNYVNGGAFIVGFSAAITAPGYNDLQYAFYIDGASGLNVYSNGNILFTWPQSNFSSGSTKIEIVVYSDHVVVEANGTVIYTFAAAPTFPLFLGATFGGATSQLAGTTVTGNLASV